MDRCAARKVTASTSRAIDMTAHTLRMMSRGGMYDQLGGGFHRYSVDARWIVPHFEKMSYDNSELLRIYLDAYAVFGTEEYAEIARGIVGWVREVMADPEGGYASSQDADVGLDDDGDYFTWTRDEAAAVLSPDELDVAAAYSLSKLRPVLGNVILGAMLVTLMIPATVLVVPQYLTVLDVPIVERNLVNSPWVIWLPSVTNAFNIFLLKRFFDSIPRELLDAAAIDGAAPLRTLRSVVLPISRPILGVVSIFAVVGVWKDFLWPMLTLPDPDKQTINVGIYSLAASVTENWLLAALVIASLPTLVIFLVCQRHIMSGLTAGSLKG